MLQGNFFTIQSFNDAYTTYRIALNGSHPIFQAHFAGIPMMPGACIVQIIKELASYHFGRDLFVCAVKNMKFLHAINPSEFPEISVRLTFTQQDDEHISIAAVLHHEDMVFTKSTISGRFTATASIFQETIIL